MAYKITKVDKEAIAAGYEIIDLNEFYYGLCPAAESPDQTPEVLQAICNNHKQGQ